MIFRIFRILRRRPKFRFLAKKGLKPLKTNKMPVNTIQSNNHKIDKHDASMRVQAYFKPGSKHSSWKWNAGWLFDYYSVLAGTKGMKYLEDAIYRKIEEVIPTCTRIIVYDNRPGDAKPILMEIVNGRIITDNRSENEKKRRALKLY